MSCPKTQHLITEYFADDLPSVTRNEIDKHLQSCSECTAELNTLLATQKDLSQWADERVPHWDRGTTLFRQEHRQSGSQPSGWLWQWLPTAASLAMLCILVFNVSVSRSDGEFTISFGSGSGAINGIQLEQRLTSFAEMQQLNQQQALQAYLVRADERQDSNNLRLMQAVIDQTQQTTAENFEQIYSYFEQQRLLDLDNVQVSYQQLVDSDYETLRTMQQLANYVRYQGEIR